MNKNAVVEMLGFAAVAVAVLGLLSVMAADNDEKLLALSDCVTDRWEEYETQTNRMPSVSMEKEWYAECGAELRGE